MDTGLRGVQVTALREVVFSGKQKADTSSKCLTNSSFGNVLLPAFWRCHFPRTADLSQAPPRLQVLPPGPPTSPSPVTLTSLRGSLSRAFSQHLHSTCLGVLLRVRGAWSTPKLSAFASCISRPKGKMFKSSNSL